MKQRFKVKLREQFSFLDCSLARFDQGFENEAIRLATSLRVIFHDGGKNSVSLLTHLDLKHGKMLSSSRGHGDWKDYLKEEINLNSHQPIRMLPLLGDEFIEIAIGDWWLNEPVFVHLENFTRRSIVLSTANKDGGAHVDATLDEFYEVLCAGKYAIGITGDLQFSGNPPFPQGITVYPQNAHFALLRQFAHETFRSAEYYDWLK